MSFKFYYKVEKFLAIREKYKFDKFDRVEEGYNPCVIYPTDPDSPYWEICLYPHKPTIVNLYSEDPRRLTYQKDLELSKQGRRRTPFGLTKYF